MKFEENPFRVLGVSIHDTKATVFERAENLSFVEPDKAKDFEKARDILGNPKKRIAAEFWEIVGNEIFRDLDNFTEILIIDKKFSALNAESIRKQINAARAKSKFPAVQDTAAIKSELKNLRYEIRERIKRNRKPMPHRLQVCGFNGLADRLLKEKSFGVVVEDFFENYRLEMTPFFEATSKKIFAVIAEIKFQFKADFSRFFYEAEPEIKAFVEARKPLDKFSMALGMNKFDETEKIFYKVREVAIKLFNEKDLVDYPLQIIRLLEENFSYLPSLAEIIRKDIEFLEETKTRLPTQSFLVAIKNCEAIKKSMERNLHFEKGFERENLDFYTHFFRSTHEVTLNRLMFRRDMKLEEWRVLNKAAATIYIMMGTAMTWTHFHPKTVLVLFQKALPYAEQSGDAELISIAHKRIEEWQNVNWKIYRNSNSSGCFTVSAIFCLVLWLTL